MSTAEAENIFAVEPEIQSTYFTPEAANVLNKPPSPIFNQQKSFPDPVQALKPDTSAFETRPMSPTFMLSSLNQSSESTQNILNLIKARMESIKPWNTFFALDQFHIPQSITAAQSKVTHNASYFQNNYIMIALLLTVFSL